MHTKAGDDFTSSYSMEDYTRKIITLSDGSHGTLATRAWGSDILNDRTEH